MPNNMRILHIDRPHHNVCAIDYVLVPLMLCFSRLLFYQKTIINIPYEIQYPYLYVYGKGLRFISYVEQIRKLLHMPLYWENTTTKVVSFHPPLTASWGLIPKDIDLVVNVDYLKRRKNELRRFYNLKKDQIKYIWENNTMTAYIP